MRFLIPFLLLATSIFGQTTVYLRSSGPAAATIASVANGTPPTVITKTPHGLVAGDVVGIWGICTGAVLQPSSARSPVNGIRKVASSPAPTLTTFAITDTSGTNIVGNGNSVPCDSYNGSNPSGGAGAWVSKLNTFTPASGVLGWLDGDNGPHTRKLALGTANGLTSLVVASNVATVTTSYTHGVSAGDKISVTGSGNTALDTCNGTGAFCPYTVLASPAPTTTTFAFTTAGVPNGTYSNANNHCGPAPTPDDTIGGSEDCLRISQVAYTGNWAWDKLIQDSDSNLTPGNHYKFGVDGGANFPSNSNGSILFGYQFSEGAIRFLVDQQSTQFAASSTYFLTNFVKMQGVNWICNTLDAACGLGDFEGNGDEVFNGTSMVAAVALRYLSSAHRATFLGMLYNNTNDPGQLVADTSRADFGYDNNRQIITSALSQGGDGTHVILNASDSQASGFYVGNVVVLAYKPAIVTITTGTTTTIQTASDWGSASGVLYTYLTGVTGTGTCSQMNGIQWQVTQIDSTHYTIPFNSTGCTSPTGGVSENVPTSGIKCGQFGLTVAPYGVITAYNASTKSATIDAVNGCWVTPNSGMWYKIYQTATISATTAHTAGITLTGVNTHFNTDLHVGDAVMLFNAFDFAEGFPHFYSSYVTGITSDTVATVTNNSPSILALSPSIIFFLHPWQTGDAGFIWLHNHWQAAIGAQPVLYPTLGGASIAKDYGPVPSSNNGIKLAMSRFSLGLIAAPYDQRAINDVAMAQGYGFDFELAHYMNYFSGATHSGCQYGPGVIYGMGLLAQRLNDNIQSYPAIDNTWLQNSSLWKIYGDLPDHNSTTSTQVGTTLGYGSECGTAAVIQENNQLWGYAMDPIFGIAPTSDRAKYLHYWETLGTGINFWAAPTAHVNYQAGYNLIYDDPRIGVSDYKVQPLQYGFLKTSACGVLTGWACGPSLNSHAVISRTSWTDRAATLVYYGARAYYDDHDVNENGQVFIHKVGGLVGIDDIANEATTTQNMQILGDMIEMNNGKAPDGSGNLPPGPQANVIRAGLSPIIQWASGNHGTWDAQYGDQNSNYVYACSDLTQSWINPIDYARGCIVHLKKAGTEEVVVDGQFVSVASNPIPIERHIHYSQNGQPQSPPASGGALDYNKGLTTCPGSGGCPNLDANRTILSLEDGGTDSFNPARNYGVVSKFFSPGTVTLRDDSPPVSVTSVTPGNPTVFNAPANGIVITASISNISIANPAVITTATPHNLTNGQFVQLAGVTSSGCNFDPNQYHPPSGSAYVATVIDATHISLNQSTLSCATISGGSTYGYPYRGVTIFQATGNWSALNTNFNSPWQITFIDNDHFSVPVDSTGFSGTFNGIVNTSYPGSLGNSHRVSICAGAVCGGVVSGYEAVVVHKISSDHLTDTTLTATALNPDANWTGVQTTDASGTNGKVVLLARGNTLKSSLTSFSVTNPGTLQFLLGGVAPGVYTVSVGGVGANNGSNCVSGTCTVSSAQDASLYFETAGTGAVSFSGSAASFAISTGSLPSGTTSSPYTTTLATTGGTGAVSWGIVSGLLCDGLSLDATTGVISGTPYTSQICSMTFAATDSSGAPITVNKTLSIAVSLTPPTCSITTSSLPGGTVGTPYSQTIGTANCTPNPPTSNWTVSSGTLCAGLTLNSGTGTISGTPTTPQTCSFTIQVIDTVPHTAVSGSLSITVASGGSPNTGTAIVGGKVSVGGTVIVH